MYSISTFGFFIVVFKSNMTGFFSSIVLLSKLINFHNDDLISFFYLIMLIQLNGSWLKKPNVGRGI